MITRIQAERYRCFEHLDVRLTEWQVLVGVNGAGKSTLLDIPVLLGDLMQAERVGHAFLPVRESDAERRRVHRLQEIIHQCQGSTFGLAIEARLPPSIIQALLPAAEKLPKTRRIEPGIIRYEVTFEITPDPDLQVTQEYLYLLSGDDTAPGSAVITSISDRPGHWFPILERNSTLKPTIQGELRKSVWPAIFRDNSRLGLAAIPSGTEEFQATTWLQERLRALAVVYQPDWKYLQKPVPPSGAVLIDPSARTIPPRALWLYRNQRAAFDQWVAHVRTALPTLVSITPDANPGDAHVFLRVAFEGGYEVASSGLSEGTWRILALTLPTHLPTGSVPEWFAVEEPETALHPHAITAVIDSLRNLYDTQVLISTHSPLVLATAQLDDIIVLSRGITGATRALRGAAHPHLKTWKQEADLGTLYVAGVLA